MLLQVDERNWQGGPAQSPTNDAEIELFAGNGDAFMLYKVLDLKHGWRKGGEFLLANETRTIFEWSLRRWRRAVAGAVVAAKLEILHAGGRGSHDPPVARLRS